MPTSTKKRWLLFVPPHLQQWIRETADETGLLGSEVISELIERVIKDGSKQFKASLAIARTRRELENIQEKRAALEQEEQALQRKLKE